MTLGGGLAGYTPKQVEEVKLVLRLLPIFATTVLYWWVAGAVWCSVVCGFVGPGMGRRASAQALACAWASSLCVLLWKATERDPGHRDDQATVEAAPHNLTIHNRLAALRPTAAGRCTPRWARCLCSRAR